MSLSSETPSLLSAEAHLRMLVNDFYVSKNAGVDKMPAAAQAQRIIRTPLPIPDELFGDIPPISLPVENELDTVKSTLYRVVAAQAMAPGQEAETIRSAQALIAEQAPDSTPVVGFLALTKMVNYTKRNIATAPPTSRTAGRVTTQINLTIVRDIQNFDDTTEYRVFSRVARQVTPAIGSPEPIEELAGLTLCFDDQLIPVNRYLINTLVDADSKSIDALIPENFA